MLRKLTVENFFSIKDAQTLDLEIARNATDPDGRFVKPIAGSDKRFPKVVAIFGANASGKTNVLRALAFLKWFVRDSFTMRPDEPLPFSPFEDEESRCGVTRLSMEFDGQLVEQSPRCVYTYALVIQNEKTHYRNVVEESLKYAPAGRPRRIFERLRSEINAGPEFALRKRDLPKNLLRPNASAISTLAQYAHDFSTRMFDWAGGVQTNVFPRVTQINVPEITKFYVDDPSILERLNDWVRIVDLGVENIFIESGKNGPKALFQHHGLDKKLSVFKESQGTLNFFALFPYLDNALLHGGLAVLDEVDNDIHPLILPELVRLFQHLKTNAKDAQLIISCHNATLLEYLEKEEVFFTEKHRDGRTRIYGLQDIQGLRRDANIYAKYLGGVFGAVPRVA